MKVSDQPSALFDYTEAEWSKIEETVQPICNGALTKEERVALRDALVKDARAYLACMAYPRIEAHRQWRKIVRQFDKLLQMLSVAVERALRYGTAFGPKTDSVARTEQVFREQYCKLCDMHYLATQQVEYYRTDVTRLEDKMYCNPRIMYEWQILTTWTNLGGKLRRSRDRKTQKIGGPLARFFRAVTVPVMGARAPSLESLPEIIYRKMRDDAFEKAVYDKLSGDLRNAVLLAQREQNIHLSQLRDNLFKRP